MIARESQTESIENLTLQFDQTLMSMKLMPASKAGRDWSQRFAGCFKLLKLQIALLLIQYLVLMILISRII
jgi:hypothetical protein